MPFKIKFADITKYKGDAIINSIGLDGRVHGFLCKAILKTADSKELTSIVNSKTKNKVGDIFVTKGYHLPCSNIIHVVSPFKDKDTDNKVLMNIYQSIIDKAIELGYKSIALPFLGTGANGYLDSDAYDAVTSVCADLVEREEQKDIEILDVTLIVKGNQKLMMQQEERDFHIERLKASNMYDEAFEYEYESKNQKMIYGVHLHSTTLEQFKKNPEGHKLKRNAYKCVNLYSSLNSKEFMVPEMLPYDCDYEFVDDYINQKNMSDKVLAKHGLDRRLKGKFRDGQRLKKIDIYRIGFSLDMPKEIIVQFMMMCNYSFNPQDELDLFYIDYISGKYPKVKTLVELSLLSDSKCGYTLLW